MRSGVGVCSRQEQEQPAAGDEIEQRDIPAIDRVGERGVGNAIARPDAGVSPRAASLASRLLRVHADRRAAVPDIQLGDRGQQPAAHGRQAHRRRHDVLADRLHHRVARQHQARGEVGAAQDVPRDGVALGFVGVEQARRGEPSRRQRQLPAKVEGVLDAGVHALPPNGAVDVGGVAGQEDRSFPVARRRVRAGCETPTPRRASPMRRSEHSAPSPQQGSPPRRRWPIRTRTRQRPASGGSGAMIR